MEALVTFVVNQAQKLAKRSFDLRIRQLGTRGVNHHGLYAAVVLGQKGSQGVLMQPKGFAHTSAQKIAFNGAFEAFFGHREDHLYRVLRIGHLAPQHAQRKSRVAIGLGKE